MNITYTTFFQAPPSEVFRYLDDPKLALLWLETLVSIEPLTEGPNHVGAKARHTYRENGRDMTMIEETLVYEPDRRVKLHGDTEAFQLIVDYRLTEENGGTRLHFYEEVKPKGLIMRLVLLFTRGMMTRQLIQGFDKLKSLVEAPPHSHDLIR